jgi:uncharacterized membrane protein YphA (DoxX/SURF4 family)
VNSYLKGLIVGIATSILAAFLLVVGFVAWLIHNAPASPAGSQTAVSWDLRSVANTHLLGTLVATIVIFFGVGFLAGFRMSSTRKTQ